MRTPGHVQPRAITSSITDYGPAWILNYSQDTFAITVQPTTSNGRLANHLYMWTNSNYSTQRFDELYDSSNSTYIWKSDYNGKCMNVPGATSTSGTQMIVYSCSGYPANERFHADAYEFYVLMDPLYNPDIAVAIGTGFPGNGAWVIIYAYHFANWKEQWIFTPA